MKPKNIFQIFSLLATLLLAELAQAVSVQTDGPVTVTVATVGSSPCVGIHITVLDPVAYPFHNQTLFETDPVQYAAQYPGGAFEYLWIFDDGSYSYEESLIHNYSNTGTHTVILELTPRKRDGGPPPTILTITNVALETCGNSNLAQITAPKSIDLSHWKEVKRYDTISVIAEFDNCLLGQTHYSLHYDNSQLRYLTTPYSGLGYPTITGPIIANAPYTHQLKFDYNSFDPAPMHRCVVFWFEVQDLDLDEQVDLFFQQLSDSCSDDSKTLQMTAIHGPYDPNYKKVSISRINRLDISTQHLPLEYTIHFTNTGEGEANTIIIKDELENYFNPSSVEYLDSHLPEDNSQVAFTREGNTLTWNITNAELSGRLGRVGSTTDDSSGWVKFRVNTDKINTFYTFPRFDVLNRASITFEDPSLGNMGTLQTDFVSTTIYETKCNDCCCRCYKSCCWIWYLHLVTWCLILVVIVLLIVIIRKKALRT